jgi:anaphase-promoting complex subunit 6
VLDCLSKHLGTAAVYFADKLVTLSEGAPEDVFLLAQAHWHNGAHARALALLRAEGLATASPRFLHLTCACLVELQQHEEALSLLGEAGSPFRVDTGRVLTAVSWYAVAARLTHTRAHTHCRRSASAVARDDGVATTAACELLRGRVYLALENRSAAARCFKARASGA